MINKTNENELIHILESAVINGDSDLAKTCAGKVLEQGMDVVKVFNEALIKGIKKVGDQFGDGEIFLPDLILSSEAMKSASDILEEALERSGKASAGSAGKLVIGTVKGDVHDIGKTLVATLFKAAGFSVIDLGVDVSSESFIEAVRCHHPDILGLSSLLTSSAVEQKRVIELLRATGLRSKTKVMVGGGAITPAWAQAIGADAYGGDARAAVTRGTELICR